MNLLNDWRACLVGALLFLLFAIMNGSYMGLVYSCLFYYLAVVRFGEASEQKET